MRFPTLAHAALVCAIVLTPVVAHAGKKSKAAKKPKASAIEKGGGKAARSETALFDAMAQANRAAEALEQTIVDVLSAGDDARKIKQIADTYAALGDALRDEAVTLNKQLSKSEKRQVENYRKAKLHPLEHKWAQILTKIDKAVASEVADQEKALHNQLDDLIAECDGLVAQTRSGGGDSARRPELQQRLARLQLNTHALYHDASKIPGRARVAALTREIDTKLEAHVRRAEWLLRMAVLPPCPEFTAQVQALHKQVQELEGLAADYALAVNRSGLNELLAKRGRLLAGIDATTVGALSPDETVELKALRDELLGPVDAKLDEAQNEAIGRVGAGGSGKRR